MLEAKSRKVFIVHGHEEAALHSTETLLPLLGLEPIVLRDRPNGGRTIFSKFEGEARQAGFAIVLLTPDDLGGKAGDKTAQQRRARQNVIFEFGYFVGVLGAKNVAALVQGNLETPSDVLGVAYIDLDRHGDWRAELARELRDAGYTDVDPASPAIRAREARSYPLSLGQSRDLIEALSDGTATILRQLVSRPPADDLAVGRWGDVKKTLGIATWAEFRGPRTGLSRVMRRLTNDPKAELIWWVDDEWQEDGKGDYVDASPIYIDGRAVGTLRQAFGLG